MLSTYHTDALLNALSDLHHLHDRQYLYTFALNRASDVLKSQGGTYFTLREDGLELYPEASKGVSLALLREIPFKLKTGVAGWVATNRTAVVLENAQNDDRFNRAVDVITGIRTKSILCVPVVRGERLLGVLELVNRVDGVFREADMLFAQHLVNQVGIAIENCDLYEQARDLLAYTDSVISSLTGGFISTDNRGVVTRFNSTACRILNVVESDVLKKPLLQSLTQYPAMAAILDVTQKNEMPVQRQEIELQRPSGEPLLIGYSTFLIRSESRVVLGAGMVFQDITNIKRPA